MQANNNNLNVKLVLSVPGSKTPVSKRVQFNSNFEALLTKAKVLVAKHDMADDNDPVITYRDKVAGTYLEVDNDNDLGLAVSKAMKTEKKQLTFYLKTSKSLAAPEAALTKDSDEEVKGDEKDTPAKGKKDKAPKIKKEKREKTDEEKAQDLGRVIKRFCKKVGANPCEFSPEDFAKAFGKEEDLAKMFGDPAEWQKKFALGKVWNQKRAVIVKKPEGVIQAFPGQTILSELEVLNDTKQAWKPGCHITISDQQTETDLPIQIFNVPITAEMKGKHQEKIEIPLTVPDHMVAGAKVYEIYLTFRNKKGNPFGQRIPIKIKVGAQTPQ